MKYLLILLSAFAAFGCAQTSSTNVKTEGMYVQFAVTGYSDRSTEAHVTFSSGGPLGTRIRLEGGDTITCNGEALHVQDAGTLISYYKNFPYVAGQSYEFVFSRPGQEPKIARVTLPEPISLISPMDRNTYKSGHPIDVSWTPSSTSADVMRVILDRNDGSGSFVSGEQSFDLGRMTIPGSETTINSAKSEAKLELKRKRAGSFPEGFTGGVAEATERREIKLFITK